MEGNPPFQTVGRAGGLALGCGDGRTADTVKKGALAVRSQEGGREGTREGVCEKRYEKIGLDPS